MAFKVNNETKIGVLSSIAILLLILGYNYLLGKDFFTSQNIFYAKYDLVDGLMNANPVKIRGMNVGRVMDMVLLPNKSQVVVKFSVKSGISVPKGTVAKIISADILGAKAIELELTDNKDNYHSSDTLPSQVQESITQSVEAEVAPIKKKTENILASIDSIFNPQTRDDITASVKTLRSTLDNVNKSTAQLNNIINGPRLQTIIANIESITNTIKDNEQHLADITKNLDDITDSVKKWPVTTVINNTSDVLARTHDILEKINKGEGTMGLLVNDQKLYNDLDSTSKDLNSLLEDLKANPKRYVHFSLFGGKNK